MLLALCEGNLPVTREFSYKQLALCEGYPPVTSGFSSQKGSNADIVSMS